MLVAFCKNHGSEAKVKIIKFADRIWVNDMGDIECHREIYLDLEEGKLRQLSILTLFRHILDLENLSDTFLDENYPVNLRSTGKYKLKNKNKRIFSTDSIDDIYAIPIRPPQYQQVGDCSLIEVIFEDQIKAPAKLALRLSFKITSMVESLKEGRRLLILSYFESRQCEQACKLLDAFGREIKAVTILDKEKSGGFDILVHLPAGVTNVVVSEHGNIARDKLEPNGKEEGENRHQCIWHMRQFFRDEVGKEIGLENGRALHVEYNVESLWEKVIDLQETVKELQGDNKELRAKAIIGKVLQLIGLALGGVALLFSVIGVILYITK